MGAALAGWSRYK